MVALSPLMHRLPESASRLPQSETALRIAQARDFAPEEVQAKRQIVPQELAAWALASNQTAEQAR
jgi:hypothetical protein